MKLRHQDIFINPDNPFEGCKLERKQYADTLTELVKSFSDGFVLAVNNKWGTGKTTFILMWKRQLELSGFKTLYFNAWENDFEANPMSAILAELKSLLPETQKDKFKPLIEKGTVIVKNLIPSIAKAIVSNYIDIKGLDEVAESAIKGGAEILEEEVKNDTKRQKGLTAFQVELGKYLYEVSEGKPLIFIVDELDRCRPNYAVEVLENIKHFFSVKGVVFVLSIDKQQLCNAVKGVYGTVLIDADEYLRRFIDLEYSIPEPSTKAFVQYLYNYYDFAPFLQNSRRVIRPILRDEPSGFIDFSILLFEGHKLTLRQQDKLFSHARIAMNSFQLDNIVLPQAFVFLTYVYQYDKEVYFNIKARNYDLKEFTDAIVKLFPKGHSEESARLMLSTYTILLYMYNNYYRDVNFKSQIYNENSELQVDLHWQIPNAEVLFKRIFELCDRDYYQARINYLLSKIELLENLK